NNSRKRNMIRARSTTGVSAQAGSAFAAACTARSTSAAEQSGTRAIAWPVEGLYTLPRREAGLASHWPPTRSLTGSTAMAEVGVAVMLGLRVGISWHCTPGEP